MAVTQLISPYSFFCSSTTQSIIAQVKNVGTDTVTNFAFDLTMTGLQAGIFNLTITDTIPPDSTKNVLFTIVTPTNGGVYHFKFVATTIGDANHSNDTLLEDTYVATAPGNVTTKYGHRCNAGTVTLHASAVNGFIYWYAGDTTSTLLSAGNNFTTPVIAATTTYYVEPHSYVLARIGPSNNGFGSIGNVNFYNNTMLFDVEESIVLDSVKIYPSTNGNVVIRLLDASNTVLNSVTVPVNNVVPGQPQNIGVGFLIVPAINYKLDAVGTTTGLGRNTAGAQYPYGINHVVNITGNTLSPNYYLYFYDWQLHFAGCPGTRIPITAQVNHGPPTAAFNVTSGGGSVINFFNTSVATDSVIWYFGDGGGSYNYSPVHSYPALGTYTVKLIAFNDCGSDTLIRTINVPTSSSDLIPASMLKIYPNPVNDVLHIVNLSKASFTEISIYNQLGQRLLLVPVNQTKDIAVDVKNLSSGIYVLRSNDSRMVARFIKE